VPHVEPFDDENWDNFILSELLSGLREASEKRKKPLEEECEGNKAELKKAELFRRDLAKLDQPLMSNAATFVRKATSGLGALIKGGALIGAEGKIINSEEAKRMLNLHNRVERALSVNEQHLRLWLPDLIVDEEHRWPGPISYRSALNHFVAVSLRVHSIVPEVSYEEVVYFVARRVLVPALAHNMKFIAKEYPRVYRSFVHDSEIDYAHGLNLKAETRLEEVPSAQRFMFRKWTRLLNILFDAGALIGPAKKGELFRHFQDLLREYEAEPRTSKLWGDLSILASGDLAVDEMLVSWVLEDVGRGKKNLEDSPIINCARKRFGLLRYAYAMQEEQEQLRNSYGSAEPEAEGVLRRIKNRSLKEKLDDELVQKAFGWAYLLSRYVLLGRMKQGAGGLPSRDQQAAAKKLCEILDALSLRESADDEEVRLLALRYLLGFLTNPRFVKSENMVRGSSRDHQGSYSSAKIETYVSRAAATKGMPRSIVNMSKARIALHHASASKSDNNRRSREMQSALDHYSKILEELAAPKDSGIMDGEVIAWVLPEIYYTLGVLSECHPDTESHWKLVKKSLLVIGEVKYGVYYNPQEEMERIRTGLNLAVGVKA